MVVDEAVDDCIVADPFIPFEVYYVEVPIQIDK